VEYFEPDPDWDGPYFGADWGFAQDPTTLVKCWIGVEGGRQRLYVEKEVYRIGLELDQTKAAFEEVVGAGLHTIRADNARPETISYLRRQGLNIVGAPKGKGSVEDGIAFLRGFEQIIIHPDCPHTAEESRLCSYKTDRLTGDVLPVIVDAHNHCIDGLRYALEPVIKAGPGSRLDWS
jgi:phage terminase large subunit